LNSFPPRRRRAAGRQQEHGNEGEEVFMETKNLSPDARLDLAIRYYLKYWTGPYREGQPAQPSKMRSSVEEDGCVTLRNQFIVLAKLLVSDDGQIKELDFGPYESQDDDY
jgi:hypothetical protein